MTQAYLIGRIVWGNPAKARPALDNDNKPVMKDGQQVLQWSFGVAVLKAGQANFGQTVWPTMYTEASKLFPNAAVPSNWAWKYQDGDGMDSNNKPFADREGYAGCYVIAVSTQSFAPRIVQLVGGSYQDYANIKTGDYVRVAVDIVAHAAKAGTRGANPGLYVNPQMVEFIGFGAEIFNGPDAQTLFGGTTVALPPGASAVPLAPTGQPPMPGVPGQAPLPPGVPGQAPLPPGYAAAPPAGPAPMAYAPPAIPGNPTPAPGMPAAPVSYAAPPSMPPAAAPGIPAPIASPSNPPMPGNPAALPPGYAPAPAPVMQAAPPTVVPAHDFVQNAVAPAALASTVAIYQGQPVPPGYNIFLGHAADGRLVYGL